MVWMLGISTLVLMLDVVLSTPFPKPGFGPLLPPPVRPRLVGPDSLPPLDLQPETGNTETESILAQPKRPLKVGAGFLSTGEENRNVSGLSFSRSDSFSESCGTKPRSDCACPTKAMGSGCQCKVETTDCDDEGESCTCCTKTSCKSQQYQNLTSPELGNWPELNMPVMKLPEFKPLVMPKLPDIKIPELDMPMLNMPPMPTFPPFHKLEMPLLTMPPMPTFPPLPSGDLVMSSSSKIFQKCDMISGEDKANCACPPGGGGGSGCHCEAKVRDCRAGACLCCIKESCHKEEGTGRT